MNLPISQPAHDTGAMLRMLLDEGYSVSLMQDTGGAGYVADLTGPLGSQATGLGDSPAAALLSVWPLHDDLPGLGPVDEGQADDPGPVDATAAAVLAGKITELREYVGRVLGDEHRDGQAALERVSADLGRISVILAAATEETGDVDDHAEPYCAGCGHWVGIFHGMDGWHHFRGDPAPGGQRELYDADHEASPTWTVPLGRWLAPADIAVIRDALADAHAARWHREEPGAAGRADAYTALLDRMTGAGHTGGAL